MINGDYTDPLCNSCEGMLVICNHCGTSPSTEGVNTPTDVIFSLLLIVEETYHSTVDITLVSYTTPKY